jgi:hypothetical protein
MFFCDEEKFGSGFDHIREKDGILVFLAWFSKRWRQTCHYEGHSL